MPDERPRTPLAPVVERIETTGVVDGPAGDVSKWIRGLVGPGALREALSGTALGHALHPLLTDVVIGSFLSSTALDVIGGDDSHTASERLIALGIAAYPPTALTGASDWADSTVGNDPVLRVGVVHAVANSAALGLYAASLRARRRGQRRKGVAFGLLGAGALGFAGYLGGHMSYAQGVGVDQTVFDAGPGEWTDAGPSSDVGEGEKTRVVVSDTPVLLLRRGSRLHAIHDRCSHRGCSLSEWGETDGEEIECNCHGSRFSLTDGSLRRGPATRPQPAFETRERDGRIELKAAHS